MLGEVAHATCGVKKPHEEAFMIDLDKNEIDSMNVLTRVEKAYAFYWSVTHHWTDVWIEHQERDFRTSVEKEVVNWTPTRNKQTNNNNNNNNP